jgi:signal peptidase I
MKERPVTQPDTLAPETETVQETTSTSERRSKRSSFGSAAWELVQTVVLAVVLFLVIRNVVQNFRIDGISMEPNFHNGQFLIVNRFAYCPGLHLDISPLNIHLEKTWCLRTPKRGDVIVFEYPKDLSRDFIKRVIGLPGDTVEVRDGSVYVNGQLMPEPFGPNPGNSTNGPITVGPDQLFVMGDNRNNSSDSRTWGQLPLEYVIGKALLSYWPPRYWAVVPRYDLTDLSANSP